MNRQTGDRLRLSKLCLKYRYHYLQLLRQGILKFYCCKIISAHRHLIILSSAVCPKNVVRPSFESLEIRIWDLFVICFLVLGILLGLGLGYIM